MINAEYGKARKAGVFGFGPLTRGFIFSWLRNNRYQIVSVLSQRRWQWWIQLTDANRPTDIPLTNVERDYLVANIEKAPLPDQFLPATNPEGATSGELIEVAIELNLIVTAVRAPNLNAIAPQIADIVLSRAQAKVTEKLVILLIENLSLNAAELEVFKATILEQLSTEYHSYFLEYVKLVDTVVEVTAVSEHGDWGVTVDRLDRHIYTSSDSEETILENLNQIRMVKDLKAVRSKKLMLHNFMDTATAYLGAQRGHVYIREAISDNEVYSTLIGAVREIVRALIAEYPEETLLSVEEIIPYVNDLVRRLKTEVMEDTIQRIARDPIRKLGDNERFMAPLRLALKHGIFPANLRKCIDAAYDYVMIEAAVVARKQEAHESGKEYNKTPIILLS